MFTVFAYLPFPSKSAPFADFVMKIHRCFLRGRFMLQSVIKFGRLIRAGGLKKRGTLGLEDLELIKDGLRQVLCL